MLHSYLPMPDDTRKPQAGEPIVLADGRRFVVTQIEHGGRGWWFMARAEDGSTALQGNLRLEWDSQAGVWRPTGTRSAVPPSMRKPGQQRVRQMD